MIGLQALRGRLVEWLVAAAYPLWSRNGIDVRNGGFIEALGPHGDGLAQPRRARVHPRQIYAFAQGQGLGWQGDAAAIIGRGMDYFTAHYRRPDGLFRALVDADGTVLDDRALLYDQAFALLGFAAAATALDARAEYEARALELRHLIDVRLRAEDGSYLSDESSMDRRESNPHMHLLEACLAWAQIGRDSGWATCARSIVDLALSRFIRQDSGALGESYLASWEPTPGIAGRIIEPGHQFEWAWLLLRCENGHPVPLRPVALRLIFIGDRFGVHNGVAINALYDDFTVKDANARCWPQTERLKAALLAATLTGVPQYWSMAKAAATSLLPYLQTPVAGLWLDEQSPSGELRESMAPASTFYHLVGAIAALDHAL
ncbi:MAG TPA: AGE family epimerase/isomerase [Steroidobacteraceae bacterium]|nr:AGE family epimerase/isomerase [Steroidobacteraceae bacterium]